MTSPSQPIAGTAPIRRFSINDTRGVRAHMDLDTSIPPAAQYIARVAAAAGELLEFGSLCQLHLTGPGGSAVLFLQTTATGSAVMHGAVAAAEQDPALMASDLITQVTS